MPKVFCKKGVSINAKKAIRDFGTLTYIKTTRNDVTVRARRRAGKISRIFFVRDTEQWQCLGSRYL